MADDAWLDARYEKVFKHIATRIDSGQLTPGTRLSGERRLSDELGVSRETVRQGLEMAERAGLIVRIPTRGTFVAPPKVQQDLGVMDAFDSTVRELHLEPAYRLFDTSSVHADELQAQALRIGQGDELLRVRVLGQGSGLPLAFYESVLPQWVVAKLPQEPPWGNQATYQVAAEAVGIDALRVDQEFDAVGIQREIAAHLQVKTNSPAFKAVSLFTADGAPLELRTAWYPGSRYRFRVSRTIQTTT